MPPGSTTNPNPNPNPSNPSPPLSPLNTACPICLEPYDTRWIDYHTDGPNPIVLLREGEEEGRRERRCPSCRLGVTGPRADESGKANGEGKDGDSSREVLGASDILPKTKINDDPENQTDHDNNVSRLVYPNDELQGDYFTLALPAENNEARNQVPDREHTHIPLAHDHALTSIISSDANAVQEAPLGTQTAACAVPVEIPAFSLGEAEVEPEEQERSARWSMNGGVVLRH